MPDADHTYPEGFEWDEAKRQRNLAKHGIDFVRSIAIFDGHVHDRPDLRRDYGEERRLATGATGGTILVVVYTPRGGKRRLISARRARANERRTYHASHARGGSRDGGSH
jgi:uncharacterized DUF497 family protein